MILKLKQHYLVFNHRFGLVFPIFSIFHVGLIIQDIDFEDILLTFITFFFHFCVQLHLFTWYDFFHQPCILFGSQCLLADIMYIASFTVLHANSKVSNQMESKAENSPNGVKIYAKQESEIKN